MNPNAVVSTVIRIEPPLDRPAEEMLRAEGGVSVELEEGRRVRLDPDEPRSVGFAKVLDGLSKQRMRSTSRSIRRRPRSLGCTFPM